MTRKKDIKTIGIVPFDVNIEVYAAGLVFGYDYDLIKLERVDVMDVKGGGVNSIGLIR